jgi:hypothetical protein
MRTSFEGGSHYGANLARAVIALAWDGGQSVESLTEIALAAMKGEQRSLIDNGTPHGDLAEWENAAVHSYSDIAQRFLLAVLAVGPAGTTVH